MRNNKNRSLKLNIVASMVIQVVSLVINLISKRAIKYYLSVEYLGIQSIYANFCDVLNFAYFGMGTAMLFSLYGALARNETNKVASYYRYYDNLYRKITWMVLGGGIICILPVLYAVNADISALEICITYLTYMLSVVLYNRRLVRNYFIQADQRRYFVAWVTGGVDGIALILEILLLKHFHSYELFVICILVKNLFINLIFKWELKRSYSYLSYAADELEEKEKYAIKSNAADMIIYKFGSVLINNTDSIFISHFTSTAMVGIYSNYQFILLGIRSFTGALFESIRSRVGHRAQTSGLEQQYRGFQTYLLVNAWMMGVTVVCFYFLVEDFIHIWMGDVQMLSEKILLILIVNYYLEEAHNAVKIYRETAGLFRNIRIMIMAKGLLNIVLSYFMGKYWGLTGVIVATTVASAATLFWYEPKVVFGYFKKSLWNEAFYHVATLSFLAVSFFTTKLALQNLSGTGFISFLLKALICVFVSNLVYLTAAGIYMICKKFSGVKNENDKSR